MFDFSRRRFVASAAAAGAVFGFDRPMEFIPSAFAQQAAEQQNPKGMPFYRFKVGDIEVTQVFDGETPAPNNPGFIRNASPEDIKAALVAAGMQGDTIPVSYTVTILKIGGKYLMFDSGNAAASLPRAGRLAANMTAAGIEQKDISTIVITHFHGDHIFGLMTAENAQIYPNADIVMPEAEYSFWTDPSKTASLPEARQGLAKRVQATFPTWKNIRRFSGNADVVPGVKPVASYGHTPGHTSFLVASGASQFMVLADVTNIYQLFVRNPGWHAGFDQDAQMAEASRRSMFDRVVADKLMVAGYHYGMPGCGTIAKDGSSYVFTPAA